MTAEAAFLQAVLESPEEYAPRLIYADWLEENGDPERAEFIRVQCRLARMDEFDLERPRLLWRERDLLRQRRAVWTRPWGRCECYFRRGFVDSLDLTPSAFLEHGERFFQMSPLTRVAMICVGDKPCARLAASGLLRRLRGLDIRRLGPGDLETLLDAGALDNLQELRVYFDAPYAGSPRAAVRWLAAWPGLARVTRLAFVSGAPGDEGLRPLAESPYVEAVTDLTLSANCFEVRGEGIAAVLASPSLRNLKALHLPWTRLNFPDFFAGPAAECLGRLSELDLSINVTFTDRAAEALAGHSYFGNLRRLDLRGTDVGPPGLLALARSPYLTRLNALALNSHALGRDGKYLLGESSLRQLTSLTLTGHFPALRTIVDLMRSPRLPRLTTLELAGEATKRTRPLRELADALSRFKADPADVAALAGLLHCLGRDAAGRAVERWRDGAVRAPAEVIREAVRFMRSDDRRARAAAAQALRGVGAAAVIALPDLLQRLFDGDESVRGAAARTLSELLPLLPPPLRSWLRVLANPLLDPEQNLREALASPELPPPVGREFVRVCVSRRGWLARRSHRPPPPPDDSSGPWTAGMTVLAEAESSGSPAAERRREARWLLARLCAALVARYDAETETFSHRPRING